MVCNKCAKCCHYSITLSIADINREPRLLDYALGIHQVPHCKTKKFMLENRHPFVLRKPTPNAICIFFRCGNCLIYETRPQVCRDYTCQKGQK